MCKTNNNTVSVRAHHRIDPGPTRQASDDLCRLAFTLSFR
jgi:hypothetical protein